jgi:hypothetical protein
VDKTLALVTIPAESSQILECRWSEADLRDDVVDLEHCVFGNGAAENALEAITFKNSVPYSWRQLLT